jgi:hypothetical protein
VQGIGHVGEILVEYLTKESYCNDRWHKRRKLYEVR